MSREYDFSPNQKDIVRARNWEMAGGHFWCVWCGFASVDRWLFHVDHIIPGSLGGQNDLDNACVLCADCNIRKSTDAMSPRKFGYGTSLNAEQRVEMARVREQMALNGDPDAHYGWI